MVRMKNRPESPADSSSMVVVQPAMGWPRQNTATVYTSASRVRNIMPRLMPRLSL